MSNVGLTIEQALEREGEIPHMTVGVSMEPMLHTRKNIVIIKKVGEPLKKYDVVLYKRGDNYVLHRLVKITADGKYVFRGDNCDNNEYDITDDNVLGVLKGYYKGERYIDCNKNAAYRLYSRFWVATHGVRMILRRAKRKISKTVRHSGKDNAK
ncbi:MAG: S24/S26 family peptidase [Acutalibacteraceae bacterium]|nr:S24/S26 family peptidase [Acutalibacteraceae bacterium]